MAEKEEKYKYIITIIGKQQIDDDSDQVEVITEGNYIQKKDHCYIGYKEYDSDDPNIYYNNLIKVDGNTVTISRNGPLSSRLILERGSRHLCLYQTPAGNMMIGVYTKTFNNNLNENGGTLEVSYTLDFNSDLVSENSFFITIEEKNTEE